MKRELPSKEKRKEIALMHLDFMATMSESLNDDTLRPYVSWFSKLDRKEIAYFVGMVAGIYNKMLQSQDPEKLAQARKKIVDIIDKEEF